MGFFKRIFSKPPAATNVSFQSSALLEGDIFYTFDNNQVNPYKLLKIEGEDTWHVMGFEPLDAIPKPEEAGKLEISIYHFPIDKNGFTNPQLLVSSRVISDDLIGYHEYVRQTHEPEEIAAIAQDYYLDANELADQKNYADSIDTYSKAIDLVPQFFEAIDNRAFSKMDLGRWQEAIEDFELSLSLKPDSRLAEFSIGECYLRLKDYQKAKIQFEKTVAIDPAYQPARDFLKKAIDLMASNQNPPAS